MYVPPLSLGFGFQFPRRKISHKPFCSGFLLTHKVVSRCSHTLFSVHASGCLVPQGRKESVDLLTTRLCAKENKSKGPASSTYSLVHVDGVLAGDNVGDGRTSLLAGGLDGAGHFWNSTKKMSVILSSGERELRDTEIAELILTEWADTERRLSLAMWSTVKGIGIFRCPFFGGRNSVWLAYRVPAP